MYEHEDRLAETAGPGFVPSWNFGGIQPPGPAQAGHFSQGPQSGLPIQAKLEVGSVNDPLEHEADRAAERVTRVPAEEAKPQARPAGSRVPSGVAPAAVHEVLRSPGQPLDPATRAFMEPRFGFDFSRVRVHTGPLAEDSARAIGARAYTAGASVVLAQGHSAADADRKLLAHELAHVVQQTGTSKSAGTRESSTSLRAANPSQPLMVRRQPSAPDEEYIPPVNAPEHQPTDPKKNTPEVLGRLDLDTLFQKNPQAKARVEAVAAELGLDPGLLAASLAAETGTEWMRTKGKIHSEVLGMDDWFDPALASRLKGIINAHPGLGLKFNDVKKTGDLWDTSTEKKGGALKPRGILDADKSVAAWAVYMKMQEEMLRDALAKEPSLKNGPIRNLDDLTPEQRLTLVRLASNAGVGFAKQAFLQLAAGGDIPRKGGIRRDAKRPFRTAVLHMARAVHLDQSVFGRSPDDYRPPPEPISHNEAAIEGDMPWLKKLPEWITPYHY